MVVPESLGLLGPHGSTKEQLTDLLLDRPLRVLHFLQVLRGPQWLAHGHSHMSRDAGLLAFVPVTPSLLSVPLLPNILSQDPWR